MILLLTAEFAHSHSLCWRDFPAELGQPLPTCPRGCAGDKCGPGRCLVPVDRRGGNTSLDRWHDAVELWALVACLAGVTVTGWILRAQKRSRKTDARPENLTENTSDLWRQRLASPAIPCGWRGPMALRLQIWTSAQVISPRDRIRGFVEKIASTPNCLILRHLQLENTAISAVGAEAMRTRRGKRVPSAVPFILIWNELGKVRYEA
jgi:hypothetical protein